jgi:hypothetical protein
VLYKRITEYLELEPRLEVLNSRYTVLQVSRGVAATKGRGCVCVCQGRGRSAMQQQVLGCFVSQARGCRQEGKKVPCMVN